jgi:malonyl CoA-acyl carrier protein transacylase
MIYLTEILLYWQWCHLLGLDAGVVGQLFKSGGVTGHSQGVVNAAVVALATSDAHFAETAHKFLKYMFFHGVRVQQAYPSKTLPAKVLRDASVTPTPMLSVSGLPYTVLSKFIDKTNATFGASSATRKLYLSLVNSVDVCMVTGHPYALVNLQALLRTIQADPNENQDRVPFSKRKLKFHTSFMPVSVPFHCPLLEPAVQAILNDLKTHPALKDEGLLELTSAQFREVPVWCTHDNSRLVETPSRSIMHLLVMMQCVQPVQWGLTCRKMATEWGVSHVVDFSRGGASNALGRMTQRNLDGTGVQILLAATEESDDNTVRTVVDPETGATSQLGDRANIMNIKGRAAWMDLPSEGPAAEDAFPVGINWRETFGPKLLRLKDGNLALRTRYTDLFNRPPLFVSGMTPCTAEEVLCSAVINAGYSVELAGGGQHTPQLFRSRIAGIAARTKPGEGIHINLLYLNPFLSVHNHTHLRAGCAHSPLQHCWSVC